MATFTKAQPEAPDATDPWSTYGAGNVAMEALLKQCILLNTHIEISEVFSRSLDVNVVKAHTVTEVPALESFLRQNVSYDQILRILSVSQLSATAIQLLGSKFKMDYELWTNRIQSSDREWFAGPFLDRGAREFSHFNLACVEFQRATHLTLKEFLASRKLSRTVRLIRLMDNTSGRATLPRIYVLRRIAEHLRRDGKLWTFMFFNDPYIDLSAAHYVLDIPGGVQHLVSAWITKFLHERTPDALLKDLGEDGFGLVGRCLREIKSTWKLLLNDMDHFLESMTEDATDDQLMDAAPWLHGQFLLNIDYFQHQLRYHIRYVTYLTNAPSQKGLCIFPTTFKTDLLQETDALRVVEQRLKALRDRTSAILETILNINTIKQAKFAAEMTRLQREDARITIAQGETLKRLTLLNMVYPPPTFVATLFGMELASSWSFRAFIGVAFACSVITLLAAWKWKARDASTIDSLVLLPANMGSNVTWLQRQMERLRSWRKSKLARQRSVP